MNTLELFAVILAALVLVKLLVVLTVGPKKWINFFWPIYDHHRVTMVVVALLALWTGYYIFQSFTVVEVGAVALFVVLVLWLNFLAYPTLLNKIKDEALERGVRSSWLSILIWFAFAVWIMCSVFWK